MKRDISTSNYNYVCFKCRTSIRRAKTAKIIPKCPGCGLERFCLGYKVDIPKHTDEKAWRGIEKESLRRKQMWLQAQARKMVRRQHFLEQEIRRLEAMPENRDRTKQIKKLQDELSKIIGVPLTER